MPLSGHQLFKKSPPLVMPSLPPLQFTETFYEGYHEYLVRKWQITQVDSGQSIYGRELQVKDLDLRNVFPNDLYYEELRRTRVVLSTNYILVSHNPNTVNVYTTGKDTLKLISDKIYKNSSPNPPIIKWMYKMDGSNIILPVDISSLPRTEFYPGLGNTSLYNYYDTYMNSKASVLLLIGPPGTGKTSFIKGLIARASADAIVSYDNKILEDDGIFAEFISGKEKFMVLEDADSFLKCRNKTGNTIMHKFLNVADGLVSVPTGKKIVFSTNLPSVRDIDTALTRPGRCFDTLHFRNLSGPECVTIDSSYVGDGNITLAELLNGGTTTPNIQVPHVGF